jgi:hypothetical protein
MTKMMTETSSKKCDLGCASKMLWVCLLMLTSAGVGWLVGKTWLDRANRSNPVKPVFAIDSEIPRSVTAREWQEKAKIRARRVELGINKQFFPVLVDEVVNRRYPDLPADSVQKREKRTLVSLDLLDRLAVLDETVRQGLGTYDREQRQGWTTQVNDLPPKSL